MSEGGEELSRRKPSAKSEPTLSFFGILADFIEPSAPMQMRAAENMPTTTCGDTSRHLAMGARATRSSHQEIFVVPPSSLEPSASHHV